MKWTINDILALRETIDVEFKKAAGRDGKGEYSRQLLANLQRVCKH